MTDDLDEIRMALKQSPPPPAMADRRTAAISASLFAFEAASTSSTSDLQGSADEIRQRSRQSGLLAHTRRWMMNMSQSLPSMKSMMLGGASMAVMVLAVVSTQDLRKRPLPEVAEVLGTSSEQAAEPSKAEPTSSDDLASSTANTQRQESDLAQGNVGENRADRTLSRSRQTQSELAPAPSLQSAPQSAAGGDAGTGQHSASIRAKRLQSAPQASAGLRAPQDTSRLGDEAQADSFLLDEESSSFSGSQVEGRDRFEQIDPNPLKITSVDPVSTFSIDVDTASYSFMRSSLMNGVLPPKDAIRIEELINYFPYNYIAPETRETPFHADVAIMPTPWNAGTQIMRIGIKGYELSAAEKPRSNLVFLLDTSGSMNAPNKLPLLVNSFRMLVNTLDPDDTVSIVVYAGSAGTVLEPTPVSEKAKILASLDRLSAGGSTAGGEGIRQAYRLAEANFDKDGINRVILATDGDFNVGITNPEELKGFVERKRETGVFLSVIGFGRGNYNDALMQSLAQNGNGQAAYIDTLSEARKTLVDEASSALFPIAKDVKIQVEFNPARIAEYRLIGYETRRLARADFNNDAVDAGEIGSGHTVTALYEITSVGSDARLSDPLRYGTGTEGENLASEEVAFVKVRYKQPDEDQSELITRPVTAADEIDMSSDVAIEARFASAVAAFGQLLRGGLHTEDFSYGDVIALANSAKGEDPFGYRTGFVDLVRLAQAATAMERQRQ